VKFTGLLKQIEEAKMLIAKILEDGPQSLLVHHAGPIVTDSMEISKDKVGIVIGAKGVVIQEIMRRTGCKVVIDQQGTLNPKPDTILNSDMSHDNAPH
jgi:polyribonucleotide nucleotidyltransferase